jgi:hypothetical protein
MPDSYKHALAGVRADPKTAGNALGHQRAMARNVLGTAESGVAQTVTPQVADNLQRYQEAIKSGKLDKNDLEAIHKYIYGNKAEQYAKGGKVLSAIKKLSEDAQGAYKAQFTPDFYHASPSPSIKRFDSSKSKKDSDLTTPGVTFLSPKPPFSESFLPVKQSGEYKKGATMYPVSVDLSRNFDVDTPAGEKIVSEFIKKQYANDPKAADYFAITVSDPHNNWTSLEKPEFLQHLRDNGFTSFAVNEGGVKNVGVLDPSKIRGKFAKYNPEDAESPDFMKAEGGVVHLAGGGKIPEKVVKAYKLFKTKGGNTNELYPLFVNANKPVPLNEWVNAEVGPVAASGKVKSKLGELAYRPGWHAGDLPVATHIGGKSAPDLKAPDFRRPDEVWAEVEMPDDVSWQEIANQRARLNKAGKPIASTAHITDQIPEGGFYRYKTSPNMEGNWLIGGGMKVNRVLTDEEVMAINEAAGVADLPRFTKFDEKAEGGSVDGYAPGGKVGGLSSLVKMISNQMGGKAGDRLTRAADTVPNLEKQYSRDALYNAFTGDGNTAMAVMNPADFEKYAARISKQSESFIPYWDQSAPKTIDNKLTHEEYLKQLGEIARNKGFRDVPFLQVGQRRDWETPTITGHEGRHRNRALSQLGDQSTLTQISPTGSLRESYPFWTSEEYLEALKKKIGASPIVKPQMESDPALYNVGDRSPIALPELFKKGGKVKKK